MKYLDTIVSPSDDGGIATTSTLVKSLADAMNGASKNKLVFVLNGTSSEDIDPIIDGVMQLPGMGGMDSQTINSTNGLFDACRQTHKGQSDCYAALIFSTFNETNVEYQIALDSSIGEKYGYGNWRTGDNTLTNRVLPVQWAINSVIVS